MRTPLSLRAAASVVVVFAALTSIHAQPASVAKKALAVDDYTLWRSINNPELSSDGAWVRYVLQLTNVVPAQAKPVVHLRNLQTNEDIAIPNATGASFSQDSRWIAYQVDPAPERRARENGGSENESPTSATAPGGSTQPSPSGRGSAGPVPDVLPGLTRLKGKSPPGTRRSRRKRRDTKNDWIVTG